ncbi:hypothetical protein PENSPDRAFT_305839 [Peniophora sp. CONT]|nr:hypothetical protein PENSPDRAFT_305839 [Peniophora sp. CONT]
MCIQRNETSAQRADTNCLNEIKNKEPIKIGKECLAKATPKLLSTTVKPAMQRTLCKHWMIHDHRCEHTHVVQKSDCELGGDDDRKWCAMDLWETGARKEQGTAGLPLARAQQNKSGSIGVCFGGLLLARCTHWDLRRPDGGAGAAAAASSGWSCASPEREERLFARDFAMAAGSGGRVEVGDAMEVMVAV